MITLQAALKRGIEQYYEIEESEIAAEPMPSAKKRNYILFYEASEGGAGVLNQMALNEGEIANIAKKALEIMHYDVSEPLRNAEELMKHEKDAGECVAGCYNCLLSYYNQPDHAYIDRHDKDMLEMLLSLINAQKTVKKIKSSSGTASGIIKNYLLNKGKWIVDEFDKENRTATFYEDPGEEARTYLEDNGYKVVIKNAGI
jgi:hypothetical protein